VGPRAVLDAVMKKKKSQPQPGLEHSIFQRVAQSYTAELTRLPSGKYILCIKSSNVYTNFIGKSEETNQKTCMQMGG
jgi:hypothetical protein